MEKSVSSSPEFGRLFGAIILEPTSIQDMKLDYKEMQVKGIV